MSERTHNLKTWPDYFARVKTGEKPFEVRRDDRGFQKGDLLRLQEWCPASAGIRYGYTGEEVTKRVSFVLTGGQFGIEPGYVVLGLGEA